MIKEHDFSTYSEPYNYRQRYPEILIPMTYVELMHWGEMVADSIAIFDRRAWQR